MKVNLVPTVTMEETGHCFHVPVGLINIATALDRAGGIRPRIVHINEAEAIFDMDRIVRDILADDPDVLGFSSMCHTYHLTLKIGAACKRLKPSLQIILGGPQATVAAVETVERFPHVDVIVRGECETFIGDVFHALPSRKALASLPGMVFRDNGRVISTPAVKVEEDLDRLPLPDYEFFPEYRRQASVSIEVGRGCPYRCSFCCLDSISQRQHRMFSPDRIVKIIRQLKSGSALERFVFLHDTFSHDRQWVSELCRKIREADLNIRWGSNFRIDEVDPALLDEMAAAGCDALFFGLESGSGHIQKDIGKGFDAGYVTRTIREIRARDQKPVVSFIVGFPDERPDDLARTLRLATESLYAAEAESNYRVYLLAPLRGSRLYREYEGNLEIDGNFPGFTLGFLADEDLEMIRSNPDLFSAYFYIPTPHLSRERITRIPYLFLNLFYLTFTTFYLWKDPAFMYPEMLLNSHFLTALPSRSAENTFGSPTDIRLVADFVMESVGDARIDHPLLPDLIQYDLAVSEAFRQGSAIRTFSHDMGEIACSIRTGHFRELPGEQSPSRTTLFFEKKGNRVDTRRLSRNPLDPFPGF